MQATQQLNKLKDTASLLTLQSTKHCREITTQLTSSWMHANTKSKPV